MARLHYKDPDSGEWVAIATEGSPANVTAHEAAPDPHAQYLTSPEHSALDHTGIPGVGGGGVTDHGALTGLSDPDHPIAAVVGLQTALDGKAPSGHTHPSTSQGVWTYDTSEVMADPGAGRVRTNTASSATTTQISIDALTKAGADFSATLSALATGDLIVAQVVADSTNYARFTVNGTPTVVLATGWYLIPVVQTGSQGPVIGKNTDLLFTFSPGGGTIGDTVAQHEAKPDPHPQYLTSAEGDAAYAPVSHGTHGGAALASTTPAALTPDITGAVGVGTTAARDDHVHNIPAAAPAASLNMNTSNTEGTAATFARSDHSHSIQTIANAAAAVNAAAGGPGASQYASRQDHVHRVDTGTPVALGSAIAAGTSDQIARADHVHPYPTAANVGAEASGAVATHAAAADPHTGYGKVEVSATQPATPRVGTIWVTP